MENGRKDASGGGLCCFVCARWTQSFNTRGFHSPFQLRFIFVFSEKNDVNLESIIRTEVVVVEEAEEEATGGALVFI
jgi:hypothetical protein